MDSLNTDNVVNKSAASIAAEETQRKLELFAWADSVLELSTSELEAELGEAAERFGHTAPALRRVVRARHTAAQKEACKSMAYDRPEEKPRYYSSEFEASNQDEARRSSGLSEADWAKFKAFIAEITSGSKDLKDIDPPDIKFSSRFDFLNSDDLKAPIGPISRTRFGTNEE